MDSPDHPPPPSQEEATAKPGLLSALQPFAIPDTALTASTILLHGSSALSAGGFQLAAASTRFGFNLARKILGPVSTAVGTLADHALGTNTVGSGLVTEGLHGILDGSEALALLGIRLGSTLTQATFNAATSTVSSLNAIYGNNEALRALGAFTRLIQAEYSTSLPTDPYPAGGLSTWSFVELSKAAATWAALQSVTQPLYGARLARELQELDGKQWGVQTMDEEQDERMSTFDEEEEEKVEWNVVEETLLDTGEEVIEASVTGSRVHSSAARSPEAELRHDVKRYSRLCLGAYGGMGMLFFGVKLPSISPAVVGGTPLTDTALATLDRELDEESLAQAFVHPTAPALPPTPLQDETLEELSSTLAPVVAESAPPFGFWDILRGSHDLTVLEQLGGIASGSAQIGKGHDDHDTDSEDGEGGSALAASDKGKQRANSRKAHQGRRPPRFFIITDNPNKAIVLCVRGTLSIDDVATDLACEPLPFDETLYWDEANSGNKANYQVHGGMYTIALAMGGPDGPLRRALSKTLVKHPDFQLHLVGHSLGAGVAALLALIWANPSTCLTSAKSGLPPGRLVKCFGFAPPCTVDSKLSHYSRSMIHSTIFSTDAVTRFSLGHIRDIRSAAAWLCYAHLDNPGESCNQILARIIAFKRSSIKDLEEESWFNSLRTTLEANMSYADLFPPGDILWLTRPDDIALPSSLQLAQDHHRLFRVTGKVEVVFGQMLFSANMLSSHLPHNYMNAVESLFDDI